MLAVSTTRTVVAQAFVKGMSCAPLTRRKREKSIHTHKNKGLLNYLYFTCMLEKNVSHVVSMSDCFAASQCKLPRSRKFRLANQIRSWSGSCSALKRPTLVQCFLNAQPLNWTGAAYIPHLQLVRPTCQWLNCRNYNYWKSSSRGCKFQQIASIDGCVCHRKDHAWFLSGILLTLPASIIWPSPSSFFVGGDGDGPCLILILLTRFVDE